jgi:hypothetical protein
MITTNAKLKRKRRRSWGWILDIFNFIVLIVGGLGTIGGIFMIVLARSTDYKGEQLELGVMIFEIAIVILLIGIPLLILGIWLLFRKVK